MGFIKGVLIYPPLGQSIKEPHFLDTLPNKDLAPNTN